MTQKLIFTLIITTMTLTSSAWARGGFNDFMTGFAKAGAEKQEQRERQDFRSECAKVYGPLACQQMQESRDRNEQSQRQQEEIERLKQESERNAARSRQLENELQQLKNR